MVVGTATKLHASPELTVLDVRCVRAAGCVDEEDVAGVEVVLPLAGGFRRRTRAGDAFVDATVAYVGGPGRAQRIEHVSHGDRGLALLLCERLADELGLDRAWTLAALPRSRRIDGVVATAHRHTDDETWVAALDELLHGARPPASATRRAAAAHRRAVDRVREAVVAAPQTPWSLRALADVAGYAPHHLTRIFREATGMTVLAHRDRVRIGFALAMVRDGAGIADAAATFGFADHSHLTRRCRHLLALAPSDAR